MENAALKYQTNIIGFAIVFVYVCICVFIVSPDANWRVQGSGADIGWILLTPDSIRQEGRIMELSSVHTYRFTQVSPHMCTDFSENIFLSFCFVE